MNSGVLVVVFSFVATLFSYGQNLGVDSFIGAGPLNTISPGVSGGFIGAGHINTVSANNGGIAAGYGNNILAESRRSFIGSGASNTLHSTWHSFIGAGANNLIDAGSSNSCIGAGYGNLIDSNCPHSFIGSGKENYINSLAESSFIGGGSSNEVTYAAKHSFIGGGYMNNIASYSNCVIAGGAYNTNAEFSSFIGGGENNTLERGRGNALVAGMQNRIGAGIGCFIGGGEGNLIDTNTIISYSTLSGGRSNQARASFSVISGGEANVVTGSYGAIAGGYGCRATNYAFAAGVSSKATNTGSFVWCGQAGVDTTSTNNNSFTVRCQGGARFLTTSQTNNARLVGVRLNGGATAWAVLSDSNAKTGFQPIQPREVLSKVASLPVRAWEYKHDPGRRYIGPTSQDFQASFGLGDATTINTLDADGVALAAIQGLVEELQERDRTAAWRELQHASALAERDGEIEDLRKSLQELKTRVDSMSPPTSR